MQIKVKKGAMWEIYNFTKVCFKNESYKAVKTRTPKFTFQGVNLGVCFVID